MAARKLQPETAALMDVYRQGFAGYKEIVHLDMHTGYGPRDQMTLVTSPHEKRSAAEITARFGAPRVAAANPDEFYTMQGDMIDWEYQLGQEGIPRHRILRRDLRVWHLWRIRSCRRRAACASRY